jgi:hypothetical protein
MENNVLSGIAIAVSVCTAVLGIVNHKRIRSTCCGKKAEVSLDVEDTTPQGPKAGFRPPSPTSPPTEPKLAPILSG